MQVFNLNDIDEEDLAKTGLSKEDIFKFPISARRALEAGGRTALMRLTDVKFGGGTRELDAKLSLAHTPDGKTRLRLHPINKYAKNIFAAQSEDGRAIKTVERLSDEDAQALKTGQRRNVSVMKDDKALLVFFDKDTNEYIGVEKSKINPPEKINDVTLTEEQKEKMKNGETVDIRGLKVSIDPTDESGIRAADVTDEDIEKLKTLGQPLPEPLSTIEFKHSKYNMDKFTFDALMCFGGLGAFVLIGHMADVLLHTCNHEIAKRQSPQYIESRRDKKLREELTKVFPETKEKFKKKEKITPNELQRIIENHLNRPVVIEHLNENALTPENRAQQEVSADDKKATKEQMKQDFQKVNEQEDAPREEKNAEKEEIKNTAPQVKTTMKY
jgi:hypothetical protein